MSISFADSGLQHVATKTAIESIKMLNGKTSEMLFSIQVYGMLYYQV